jgi:hypothetical protein
MLKTHGTASLRSGRVLLETDYSPTDGGPGLLSLRLEDQETFLSVDGAIRLDPWIGQDYGLIEFRTGSCFLICGAQAVVAVDARSLGWSSSVGLEYEEGETLDVPWHLELERVRLLVLATERRVWCVDEHGAVRWLWNCSTGHVHAWISGALADGGDRVSVPVRTVQGERTVELQLSDGLPARA